jgi:hypothetical protein
MPRGKPSKNSKQQTQARIKDRQALELRTAGATYQQIAAKMGISLSGAGLCVSRAMDALRLEVSEQAEAVRQMELDRLDAMLLGLWEKARRGDPAAIDRVLRIQERRSKYLGLDAPTKSETSATVHSTVRLDGVTDEQLSALERAYLEITGGDTDAS